MGQQQNQNPNQGQQDQGGQDALLFRFHPLFCICLSIFCLFLSDSQSEFKNISNAIQVNSIKHILVL